MCGALSKARDRLLACWWSSSAPAAVVWHNTLYVFTRVCELIHCRLTTCYLRLTLSSETSGHTLARTGQHPLCYTMYGPKCHPSKHGLLQSCSNGTSLCTWTACTCALALKASWRYVLWYIAHEPCPFSFTCSFLSPTVMAACIQWLKKVIQCLVLLDGLWNTSRTKTNKGKWWGAE